MTKTTTNEDGTGGDGQDTQEPPRAGMEDNTSNDARDGDVDADIESQTQTSVEIYAVPGMAGKQLILQEEDMHKQMMARLQQQQEQSEPCPPIPTSMPRPTTALEENRRHAQASSHLNHSKVKIETATHNPVTHPTQEQITKEAELESTQFLETKKKNDELQPVNASITGTSNVDTSDTSNHDGIQQEMLIGAVAIGGSGLQEHRETSSSVKASQDGTQNLNDLAGLVEANLVDPMSVPQAVAVHANGRAVPWTRQDCFSSSLWLGL
ncbi:expressed unknown protein [Seminavis robusta]|uniref:Uncharacterized protein n=1 Tax=Seminavis robusta TaxID=568900 RepID=A0A9N8D5T5_9STRA|nr:expressed unknown protein [Seminavis robusta]|eukprot:Sro7_g006140.1 n/a (267) ;mRNA; r:165264-166064